MISQNGRASNKQVADLLSMVKELYALQNKQIQDYNDYAFACKLQDFPSNNRFVHVNQPFQADNPQFPEDAEGHPCFMVVERPSITPPVELEAALKPWLCDIREWTNATLPSEQVHWYTHVVRFQNVPWIITKWAIHNEGKLDNIDLAAFSENLQRIAQALTLPKDHLLPLQSKEYAREDYQKHIAEGDFASDFVEESLNVTFTLKTWECYTSDPEQLKMLQDIKVRLESLMQQAQDNFINTPYRECLRRYFAAAQVQSKAREENASFKTRIAESLRLRNQWLKQRAIEKEADKVYKLLESKLHDIERSGDGLELIAATGLMRQQPEAEEAEEADASAQSASGVSSEVSGTNADAGTDAASNVQAGNSAQGTQSADGAPVANGAQSAQAAGSAMAAEALGAASNAGAAGTEAAGSADNAYDAADEVAAALAYANEAVGPVDFEGEAEAEGKQGKATKSKDRRGTRKKKDTGINHPVLLRRVRLEQDASFGNGRILMFDNAERCELCSTLFATFSGSYTVLESDYTDSELYPWDEEKSNAFLKKLSNSLGSNCYFSSKYDATSVAKRYGQARAAEICTFPLLIMRSRKMALPSAVDVMVKQVQDEGDKWRRNESKSIVPVVVRDLVSKNSISTFAANSALNGAKDSVSGSGAGLGTGAEGEAGAQDYDDWSVDYDYASESTAERKRVALKLANYLNRLDGVSSEILLTKPANNEQLQIAENIERASAVLVQGPPGTGKTHTIANLLGHLLSQGKTVLVISENSKALRVLKDKVEPQLQDLCISILDESNADTIHALQGIIERFSKMEQSIHEYRHHTDILKREREQICQKLTSLRQQIAEQENFEYQRFTIGDKEITTAQAAQGVATHQALVAQTLPPITQAKPNCPLTLEELQQLYATNTLVPASLESHMLDITPAVSDLIKPQIFAEQAQVYQQALQEIKQLVGEFSKDTADKWCSSFRWDFSKVNVVVSNHAHKYAVPFSNLSGDKAQAAIAAWDDQALSGSEAEKYARVLSWQGVLKQNPNLIPNASENLMAAASEREFRSFHELIHALQQYDAMKGKLGMELMAYNFQLLSGGMPDPNVVLDESTAQELAQLLNAQKEFIKNPMGANGRGRPNLTQRLAQFIRVNGHEFKMAAECEQAIRWLRLELQRQRCVRLWNFLMVKLGEPSFEALDPSKQNPELMALTKLTKIERCLNWGNLKFRPFFQTLLACGLRLDMFYEPNFSITPAQDFQRLVQAFQVMLPKVVQLCQNIASNRQKMLPIQRYANALKQELQQAQAAVDPASSSASSLSAASSSASASAAMLTEQNLLKQRLQAFTYLVKAVVLLNVKEYTRFYNVIMAIHNSRPHFHERQELLRRLREVDPEWAQLVAAREGVYGQAQVNPKILEAWQWRNVACNLDQDEDLSLNTLQAQAAQAAKQYREKTTEYAASLAWNYMFERLNDSVSGVKDLRQVSSLLEQIGDGTRTGKRVKSAQKDLRQVLPRCKALIPVWIMPLARVFENFTIDQRKFDVLIVDEASQVKIYGLAALFLAKKCIIVGDDKQVSPTFFRVSDEQQMAVINKYKSSLSLPSFYNLEKSLYDLAKVDYSSIMLREQFRCVPEIINFCNLQFYDNRIKILRDATSSQLMPAMLEYYVPDGQRDELPGKSRDKTNYIEALHTVALLKACFDDPAYAHKSFGVIVMLGSEQIEVIEALISQYIPLAEQQQHELRCGVPAEFQGDERDVILMCLVDSLALDAGKDDTLFTLNHRKKIDVGQRYNVAVSRARDQLWVVTSIDKNHELKPEDIRFQLLSYAQDPAAYMRESSALDRSIEANSESDFEKRMAFCLKKLGYNFEQQYHVGSYRLDFVVKYQNHQIALECDGDCYHSSASQVAHDLERQTVLERLGWRFVRIRGSQFYRNPKPTIRRMVDEFKRLGILPENGVAKNLQAQQQEQQNPQLQQQSSAMGTDSSLGMGMAPGSVQAAGKVVGSASRQTELVTGVIHKAQALLAEWNDSEYELRLKIYNQRKLLRAINSDKFKSESGAESELDAKSESDSEAVSGSALETKDKLESANSLPVPDASGPVNEAEVKVEPKPEVEADANAANEAQAAQKSQETKKSADAADANSESASQIESEPQAEPESDSQDEQTAAPESVILLGPPVKTEPEHEVSGDDGADLGPAADAPAVKPETETEAEAKVGADFESEPVSGEHAESSLGIPAESEHESEHASDAQVEPKVDAGFETAAPSAQLTAEDAGKSNLEVLAPKPEPKPESESVLKPESESKSEVESKAELESESKPKQVLVENAESSFGVISEPVAADGAQSAFDESMAFAGLDELKAETGLGAEAAVEPDEDGIDFSFMSDEFAQELKSELSKKLPHVDEGTVSAERVDMADEDESDDMFEAKSQFNVQAPAKSLARSQTNFQTMRVVSEPKTQSNLQPLTKSLARSQTDFQTVRVGREPKSQSSVQSSTKSAQDDTESEPADWNDESDLNGEAEPSFDLSDAQIEKLGKRAMDGWSKSHLADRQSALRAYESLSRYCLNGQSYELNDKLELIELSEMESLRRYKLKLKRCVHVIRNQKFEIRDLIEDQALLLICLPRDVSRQIFWRMKLDLGGLLFVRYAANSPWFVNVRPKSFSKFIERYQQVKAIKDKLKQSHSQWQQTDADPAEHEMGHEYGGAEETELADEPLEPNWDDEFAAYERAALGLAHNRIDDVRDKAKREPQDLGNERGGARDWVSSDVPMHKRKMSTSEFVRLFEARNLKCLNGQSYGAQEMINLHALPASEDKGLRTYCNKLQRCLRDAKRFKLQCFDRIKDQALLSIYLPEGQEQRYLYNLESSGLLFVREKPKGQWFINVRPKSFSMFLKLWRQAKVPVDDK